MSANRYLRRELFAEQLEAAGLHDQAASWRHSSASGLLDWDGDRRGAATTFAWSQIRDALKADDVELVRDVGLYRAVRREEAWADHEAARTDGDIYGVNADGISELSPFDPQTEPAWAVLHATQPQLMNRLEPSKSGPSNELRRILEQRISLYAGYSGDRAACEFVKSVTGLDAGGCTCRQRGVFAPGDGCCNGESAGWVLDPWPERKVVLVWRACAGCLHTARTRGPAVGGDAAQQIHDPSGEHAKKIDQINALKSMNEHAKAEAKLTKISSAHPTWKRGDDGRWHPPAGNR